MNRRELLAACGAMTTFGAAGCNAPRNERWPSEERPVTNTPEERRATDAPENWPTFLYDSTNRRCFASDRTSGERPSIRWSYRTDDAVWASPVVADGTLYIGSYDGHLYAISTETGELKWRYRTGDRIDGSPAVVDGTVYFGSFDRNVYALDAGTGEERWIHGTRGIVRSSPTVRDGVVYVGAHCRAEECSTYYDVRWPERGSVLAFDAESGDLRWRYGTDDGVISTPAVLDGTVYVGSSDATLYALDAAAGETRWSFETDGPIMSSPTCAGGRVTFATLTGKVYAADATSGDVAWSYDANTGDGQRIELPVIFTSSPVVCDDVVYVGSMAPGDGVVGKLYAVSASDGSPRWSESGFAEAIGSSPVVVDETVYFGAHTLESSAVESGLYAVGTDGTVEWSVTFDDAEHEGFGSSPAVVGTTLYIGSTDGHVHAFELG